MSDWFQWAIVAFIVLSILWHVFKGGAANPETTGTIDRKVNDVSGKVTALSTRVGHVEAEMKDLKKAAATTKDVEKLEELIDERLNTMKATVQAHKEVSEATNRNVQRIYDLMLDKGLTGK